MTWVQRSNSSFFYLFNNVSATFDDAKAECESLGANLAAVSSPEENEFLMAMLPKLVQYLIIYLLRDSSATYILLTPKVYAGCTIHCRCDCMFRVLQ